MRIYSSEIDLFCEICVKCMPNANITLVEWCLVATNLLHTKHCLCLYNNNIYA